MIHVAWLQAGVWHRYIAVPRPGQRICVWIDAYTECEGIWQSSLRSSTRDSKNAFCNVDTTRCACRYVIEEDKANPFELEELDTQHHVGCRLVRQRV